ncbi:MAG: agmatinase [Dehalococcoidia bacterium]
MSDQAAHPEPFPGWHEGTFLPPRVFGGLEPPYTNIEQAKAVVLPVPYDSTSEWQAGSRHGPQAIIDASQYLELYDLDLECDIYEVGISTLPQVEPLLTSPQDMIDRVYQVVKRLVDKGRFVLLLGGDHSLSLGAVRAYREAFPALSVLQFDAHADLRDEYLGTGYGQACVMRRILELCPISQVGIRSLSRGERQFLTHNKLMPFYMSDSMSNSASVDRIVDSLGPDVYITIDVDVLDPSIMSAVGTPEPDGMSWRQLLDVLKSVALHRHVVGFDLMEFCPGQGPNSCAFLLAKLAYKVIGYALAQQES